MVRAKSYRPYFLLFIFFSCILNLPTPASEKIRACCMLAFSPSWEGVLLFQQRVRAFFSPSLPSPLAEDNHHQDMQELLQENQLLRTQIQGIKEWLSAEERIHEQWERLKYVTMSCGKDSEDESFFQRKSRALCQGLELQLCSLPARVVFREPLTWGSVLWINVGEADNLRVGKQIVSKFSPVLVGDSVIGIVEYVDKNRSRVRLITDARCSLSVRAVRGGEQPRFFLDQLNGIIDWLNQYQKSVYTSEERRVLLTLLFRLKSAMMQETEEYYLAKGEVHGMSQPLWRAHHARLKGVGFNYDFADEEGPARALRSGLPYSHDQSILPMSLLQPGDLLVTTGFDGVFPSGLRVAIVSSVQSLQEGATSYDLQATPAVGNLDSLTHVFVCPPCIPKTLQHPAFEGD